MKRRLTNQRDFEHNRERMEEQENIQRILEEEYKAIEADNEKFVENLGAITESVEDSYYMLKEELNDEITSQLLRQERSDRVSELSNKMFSEIVLESIPFSKEVKESKEDDIIMMSSELFASLEENDLIEPTENSAWSVLMESIVRKAGMTDRTISECYIDIVNEEVGLLMELTSAIRDKVERAVKLEKTATIMKEEKQYISENSSLFRCLVESAYKSYDEYEENRAELSMIDAAIKYTILETINTARMNSNINYDFILENYRYLGR